jgi:peptidoglycan/LPS O-acetylase OafA/YrhL
VVAIACAICLLARLWTAHAAPFSFQRNVYPTHLRIDALLFGVLLAYAFQFHPAIVAWAARRPGMLVLFGVSAVASMTLSTLERSPAIYTIGFSALYLGYGAVLFAFAAVPDASVISRIVRTRFASMICWIGIISYPMYLWHLDLAVQPIEWLLARRPIAEMNPSVRWAALTLLYVLLAVGAGWISCILVERPLLAIRDRYFPARARRPRMTDAAVSQPSRQRPSPALVSAPEPI